MTGIHKVFIAAPDRGPFDGVTDVPLLDRVHFLHITMDAGSINRRLLDTRFLKNEFGKTFVGGAGVFDVNSDFATLRLDPEGIRIGPNRHFYISDEYGPYIFEFNRQGHLVRRIDVLSTFLLSDALAPITLLQHWNPDGKKK